MRDLGNGKPNTEELHKKVPGCHLYSKTVESRVFQEKKIETDLLEHMENIIELCATMLLEHWERITDRYVENKSNGKK